MDAPRNYRGFTIVELLIVIVVIAILAAISIVAYNGIQERSKNTAIITAAKTSLNAINAYVAATDSYPGGTSLANYCITTVSGCRLNNSNVNASGNSAFKNDISTVSSLSPTVFR